MLGKTLLSLIGALAAALPLASVANDISVGGTALKVPNPSGFVPVTVEMNALYEFQKTLVPSFNEEFLVFIAEAGAPVAMKGSIPDLTRRFSVQTSKTLLAHPASTSTFAKMKTLIRSETQEGMTKLEKELPGLMDNVNRELSKKYDLKTVVSVSQVVPLPIHEESDRTLGYASLVKISVKDATGNDVQSIVVTTTTLVHVKGRILFLYCSAEEEGLEWSRQASKEWASAVVAANPGRHPWRIAIDWNHVGHHMRIGLLVGAIWGLITLIRNRRKES